MEEKKIFDFPSFINESRDVLINPKDFFANLKTAGGITEPIIKALIYGALAGLFAMIWSFLHIGGAFGGMFGGAIGVGALFGSIVGAVIGAFIGGVILLILSSICGGTTDFESNLRVAVALMVVYPISSFLNVLAGFGFWANALIDIGVNLYVLYMLFFGLTETLKGKVQTAKTIGYVLGGLLVLFLIIGVATRKAVETFSGYGSEEIEKRFGKGLEELEKAAKELEESAAAFEEQMKEAEESSSSDEADEDICPEAFPQDAAEHAKDWFREGESSLTSEGISKLIIATKELKELGQDQGADKLKVLEINGYNGYEAYQREYITAITALEGLKGLVAMQKLMEASKQEQQAAKAFTFDMAMEAMVKQTAAAGNLTANDIKKAYENWDLLVELSKLGSEK